MRFHRVLCFIDRTMAVVQKMALGIGIGLTAAGVGVCYGGARGVLAGVVYFFHRNNTMFVCIFL